MKILQINTLFTPRRCGGAEVFLERLAAGLVSREHQVLVACLSPTPARHGNEHLDIHEFHLRNVYWPYSGGTRPKWRKAIWHIRNAFGRGGATDIDMLLDREKPDLVHTHNLSGFTSAVWQTIRARRIPLIHTLHDYALLCPATTMLRRGANCSNQCIRCRLLSWPNRRHSQAVNSVVGCSRFVLDRHVRNGYFVNATHHVVHNGDPTGVAPRSPGRAESALLQVGFLGRLAPPKGIESMLDALTGSASRPFELLVAGTGDGAYEAMLKSRYEPRGVRFVGRVDPSPFLAGLDVLVVPSLWNEPCPLVLGEALTAGVPIVASTVGGIPEVVEHERSGFLFAPTDGERLRHYVTRLASDRDLHRRMSLSCRAQAEGCTFDRTLDRYLRIYEQTVS